jgi:hypothetical protein
MAKKTTNEGFNVSYYCRDKNTSDDVKNVTMSWDNRSIEEIRDNLNIWLTATGYGELQVVSKVSVKNGS